MSSSHTVETAHKYSRKRAILWALLGVTLWVQVALKFRHPWVGAEVYSDRLEFWSVRLTWLVEIGLALLVLATGGGLLLARRVRALMNSEVTSRNRAQALIVGFWIAALAGLALSVVDAFRALAADGAIAVLVSSSLGGALLTFAWLEIRADRDA